MDEAGRSSARLLRNIREEMIGLLFNRHVFRTHQEIVRRNPRLQVHPKEVFSGWVQRVYVMAAATGVRRLASSSFEREDVNLVRFIDTMICDPGNLWSCFEKHFPDECSRAREEVLKRSGFLPPGWESLACKRLLSADRKAVIRAAEKTNLFASKRAAHNVPSVPVDTKFSDLDEAIDTLKRIAEKYTLIFCSLHKDLAQVYPPLDKLAKRDLLDEMKSRLLPDGWVSVFLEPWAVPETIELPLGEMPPPKRARSQ